MPNEIDIKLALKAIGNRLEAYGRYQRYYDGRHPLAFATSKFREAFGSLFSAFADNLCPVVVQAVSERLEVIGFAVEDQGGDPTPESSGDQAAAGQREALEAWQIWRRNRMDQRADQVHLEALKMGDAYVIVWPSTKSGQVTIYPQRAANMHVQYDEEEPGLIAWAAKLWVTSDGYLRLTMYYPNRLERYRSKSKTEGVATIPEDFTAFEPYTIKGEAGSEVENPYGQVPVFHFANQGYLGDFGISEMRDAIPLQNGLNKAVMDMIVGMEFTALPQRWAVGVEAESDEREPGNAPGERRFQPGVDRLWTVENELAKFGQFDPAKLDQFIGVQDSFRMELARVTGTPLHYIMLLEGVPPSGEALKTIEARLVKKIRQRHRSFGNPWEDAMRFAVAVQRQLKGSGVMPDLSEVLLATQWLSAEPRSEKDHIQNLFVKNQLGIPKIQVLLEMDYPRDKAEQLLKEWQAEHDEEMERQAQLAARTRMATAPGQAAMRQAPKGGPRQPPSTRGVSKG